MGDPLSIASGVAGLLSLATIIVASGMEYTNSVKNCSTEVQSIIREVSSLTAVLGQLSVLATRCSAPPDISVEHPRNKDLDLLSQVITDSAIQNSEKLLHDVEDILRKFGKGSSRRTPGLEKRIHNSWNVLMWPSRAKEVENILQRLREMRNNFTAGVIVNSSYTMSEMKGQIDEVFVVQEDVQKALQGSKLKSIASWLSSLEPHKRHQDVRKPRSQGTGDWFFQTTEFQNWLDGTSGYTTTQAHGIQGNASKHRILCCYGKPGAGKTVLSSLVIDKLSNPQSLLHLSGLSSNNGTPNVLKFNVAYVYCDYRDQKNQTTSHIIGSLITQLLTSTFLPTSILEEVITICESSQITCKPFDLEVAYLILIILIRYTWVCVCVDALDELEQATQKEFLSFWKRITCDPQLQLSIGQEPPRLFLTGRPHVQEVVNRALQKSEPIHIELMANEVDIRTFLEDYIDKMDWDSDMMNETLRQEIIETLIAKSGGMFLLPALHIQTVLEEPTISKRRKALQSLPERVWDAYGMTMTRIHELPKSRRELGMSVLRWCVLGKRLLKLGELQQALAVNIGDTLWDADNIPTETIILSACVGLVVVDQESSTVRLVHYSLQEFFLQYEEHYFPSGHSILGGMCVTYLSLNAFDVCCSLHQLRQLRCRFPFLDYAAEFWVRHIVEAGNIHNSIAEHLYQLVRQGKRAAEPKAWLGAMHWVVKLYKFTNSFIIYEGMENFFPGLYDGDGPVLFTVVHYIAAWDDGTIMNFLFERCERGGLMMLMDAEDSWGMSPFFYAVSFGNEKMVKFLINRSDVGVARWASTALGLAVRQESESILTLLLQQVSPKAARDLYRVPLSSILNDHVYCGEKSMLHLLLEWGADPNEPDDGDTPLMVAAEGRILNTRMLLQCPHVDVNLVDGSGQTPLRRAVDAFIDWEEDFWDNQFDLQQWSERAATGPAVDQYACVILLLEHKDIDVNLADREGITPLMSAAISTDKASLTLLLNHDAIDLTLRSHEGKTALDYLEISALDAPSMAEDGALENFEDCRRLFAEAGRRHALRRGEPVFAEAERRQPPRGGEPVRKRVRRGVRLLC